MHVFSESNKLRWKSGLGFGKSSNYAIQAGEFGCRNWEQRSAEAQVDLLQPSKVNEISKITCSPAPTARVTKQGGDLCGVVTCEKYLGRVWRAKQDEGFVLFI